MEEIRRLIGEMEFEHPVTFVEGKYEPERFYEMAKGLEKDPEGGERCFGCYRLRMEEAARLAAEGELRLFYNHSFYQPLKKCGEN